MIPGGFQNFQSGKYEIWDTSTAPKAVAEDSQ